MRVVAGKAKGRKLASLPGRNTRPILDRVKTALFDSLRPVLPGAQVLDLFAGTGSVGIEALSQGAAHCIFTELDRKASEVIKHNLELTKLSELGEVRCTDAFRYLRHSTKAFDLIYVAPPQYKNFWQQALLTIAERPDLVASEGLIIVQIDPREYELLELSHFKEQQQRRYGNTLLVFYKKML